MKKEDLIVDNGFVIVDIIEISEKKKSGLLTSSGTKAVSKDNVLEHPLRGVVIAIGKVFYNNGVEYTSEIKVGDVVLLLGDLLPVGFIFIEGIGYPVIRYSTIVGHYKPTDVELSNFKYQRNIEDVKQVKRPMDLIN